jgi:hypothetical protein
MYGCSSSQMQYIRPEYKEKKEFNSVVMVMPFIPKYFSALEKEKYYERKNAEHKYLTTREIELFDNYMAQLISENTQVNILKPGADFDPVDFLAKDVLELKDQKIELYVPSGSRKNFKDIIPNYVILFNDIFFNKDSEEKSSSIGQGTRTYYSLVGGIEYVIWDYKNHEIVGYGKQVQKMKLLETPEKADYISLLEKFAASIVKNSPFAVKKVYF